MFPTLPDRFTSSNTVITVEQERYSNPDYADRHRRIYRAYLAKTTCRMGRLLIGIDPDAVCVEDFEILNTWHANFRNKGLGKLMMQACMSDLKMLGYRHVDSDAIASAALRVRQQLFPETATQFYLDSPERTVQITFDEAIAATQDTEAQQRRPHWYDEPAPDPQYFGVRLDLHLIDTHDWPAPTPHESYLAYANSL